MCFQSVPLIFLSSVYWVLLIWVFISLNFSSMHHYYVSFCLSVTHHWRALVPKEKYLSLFLLCLLMFFPPVLAYMFSCFRIFPSIFIPDTAGRKQSQLLLRACARVPKIPFFVCSLTCPRSCHNMPPFPVSPFPLRVSVFVFVRDITVPALRCDLI